MCRLQPTVYDRNNLKFLKLFLEALLQIVDLQSNGSILLE